MDKIKPWSHLDTLVERLEYYYGIKLNATFKSKLKNEVINGLIAAHIDIIPKMIYARCVDGEIHKGKLIGDIGIDIEMLVLRDMCEKETMTTDDWEILLAKYGEPKYTYCFDDNTLHSGIELIVGSFLMKYKCSRKIYDIVSGTVKLEPSTALLSDALGMYIKKESKIREKLDLFKQDIQSDTNSKTITSWDYVNSILTKDKNLRLIRAQDMEMINAKSKTYDIVREDLIYRVRTGISIEDAIKLGKDDCEKYGFKCELMEHPYMSSSIDGMRYNIIMYIRYMAEQEHIEPWRSNNE